MFGCYDDQVVLSFDVILFLLAQLLTLKYMCRDGLSNMPEAGSCYIRHISCRGDVAIVSAKRIVYSAYIAYCICLYKSYCLA